MDSSLKQRLLGAVILVALIVIVVPEILRGKTASTSSAPAVAPRVASAASANNEGSTPLRSVTVDMRDTAPPAVEKDAESPPPTVGPASAASATTVAAQPANVESVASKPVPVPGPPAANGEPASAPAARALPSGLPKPAPNGPWVVQLGSFALKVSAERLARELKADGYPAYVSPVQRGARELFRVRVGPMADRAAASSYYNVLRAAGKDVAIVPNR